MTEVAFHFNAPDKIGYACRFARKALRHRARLVLLVAEEQIELVSARLWSLSATDFLAHARQADGAQVLTLSPIALLSDAGHSPHQQVLLNLGAEVPAGFERFAKVIEVVSSVDELDRAQARARWKFYAGRGYAIVRHDLHLKEGA
jgi:DNA polymerase-3 subunit chi